jgi:hypothetical protein
VLLIFCCFLSQITDRLSATFAASYGATGLGIRVTAAYGRGAGVGRGRGVGVTLGVEFGVAVGVGVAAGVAVGVGVGDGPPPFVVRRIVLASLRITSGGE